MVNAVLAGDHQQPSWAPLQQAPPLLAPKPTPPATPQIQQADVPAAAAADQTTQDQDSQQWLPWVLQCGGAEVATEGGGYVGKSRHSHEDEEDEQEQGKA